MQVQFQPDTSLYHRLFAKFFLFLKQYRLPHPWQIVVIYPHRQVEREQSLHFGEILNLSGIRRIYRSPETLATVLLSLNSSSLIGQAIDNHSQ